jgi:tRNA pseudouridine55 synthase
VSLDDARGLSGLVVVDKAGGMTSHDVVSRVRRLAGTRKVGHAGTLDPMATGVLVLGVNRATRLLGHLLLTDKAYDATVRLGASTDTDDAEGEVAATASTAGVTDAAVREALAGFVGEIEQVPSAVSAIKVDGRRAYELVRAGELVELEPRRVRIDEIVVHDVVQTGPDQPVDVRVTVRCSSGTYIRAIARDLGERLGVGGHLTALRRTAVGPYGLDAAQTLEQLEEDVVVLPIGDAARQAFPSRDLDEEHAADVGYGRKLALDLGQDGPVALFAPDGGFLALYEQDGDLARAVAVFV